MKTKILLLSVAAAFSAGVKAQGCTGITVRTVSGDAFQARTYEWGSSYSDPVLKVAKRSSVYNAASPSGLGMAWKGRYGYVGILSAGSPYVNEGLNEKGLSVGVFFSARFRFLCPVRST